MINKFFGLITNNFGFKLISVIVAIFIWYAVVYYNDPVLTESFQVPVTVTNESYIENGKQLYMIDEQYKTVTVYVSGNRSELRDITANDITVTADLTQIVDLDRDPVMVPLAASCRGFDESDITLSRTTIPIQIENVASKELQVSALTGEGAVDNNYEIGKLTPHPSKITIYGPESVINSIESVVARIDVDGLDKSQTVRGDLVFIDVDQNEISDTIIDDDITIEGGDPDVTVDVELWRKRTEIEIDVGYSGEPAYGYEVTSITTTPETLTLAGNDEALKALEAAGNKISIPPEEVNIGGISEDYTTEVNIVKYLPENTKLSSSMNETVIVYVSVMPLGSTEILYNVEDIQVHNLPEDMSLTYNTQNVSIGVTGSQGGLNELTADKISASIDLSGLSEGEHTVPVDITLPSGYELVSDVSIIVRLSQA
jgi:YbbR domain-containing protein